MSFNRLLYFTRTAAVAGGQKPSIISIRGMEEEVKAEV